MQINKNQLALISKLWNRIAYVQFSTTTTKRCVYTYFFNLKKTFNFNLQVAREASFPNFSDSDGDYCIRVNI